MLKSSSRTRELAQIVITHFERYFANYEYKKRKESFQGKDLKLATQAGKLGSEDILWFSLFTNPGSIEDNTALLLAAERMLAQPFFSRRQ